ncbi:hypothetical protein AWH56_015595 [Anaerobacillus isosaccharinicus]|uniref:Uncharacterized protein n=1 Tax=Anaerobacillus isosaccharinicus TaxID=1532552 RepID=A0A7S7L497_9BACI|nr:hypothetical protein [Anaerobacillus isosaccharinicus]MBA5587676.1 hypothetical protein [Anaerobacillus isosaccharinicus]QOY34152.1 hypothetical protein AWH56_015595 [Anaerobacillus isosaccharinicus]
MGVNQIVIGLAIFIVVIVVVFLMFSQLFQLNEVISVIIAFASGLGAEILYRKKARSS